MASCVLVGGLDASVNCGEMTTLFADAGSVVQSVAVSPANDGSPGAALIYFAEPRAAAEAVSLFDGHPFAGCFLEVKKVADMGAAARVLAALAEVQGAPPAQQAASRAPSLSTGPAAEALAAPSAGPSVAFGSGPAVPLPQPFSGAANGAGGTAGLPTPTVSTEGSMGGTHASVPEPPEFDGGEGEYNPSEWLPPADWQPAAQTASQGAWSHTAAPSAQRAQQAGPAGGRGQAAASAGARAGGPKLPEWEVDSRCRIFLMNLRYGCSADDLRAYFSKFGQIIDASVVPKQQIGFLTFARGDDGQAALEATNGASVPNLSASGAEPLHLEFRSLEKIKRHVEKKRMGALDTPTNRIFIGHFPRNITREALRVELSRFGELNEVMVGGGEDGGDQYCFAQFRRVQDAASAQKALHGHTIPSLAGARQLIAVFKEPRR